MGSGIFRFWMDLQCSALDNASNLSFHGIPTPVSRGDSSSLESCYVKSYLTDRDPGT